MRKSLTILTVLAGLTGAGAVRADDDDCWAPMAEWQPREAVGRMAESKGWTVRRIKIDDGCYEIHGRDADGRVIEVTVDPATLKVLDFEYESSGESSKPQSGANEKTKED